MRPKVGVLVAVIVAAVPLAIVATAFACGSLATLKLNRATASAGDPVTARGGNFNSSPRASTVQVRFNGRNGRILWEGRPNANGRLTATFDAPSARPGYYVIVATQTGPDGRPAAGTPGRAPLRIRGGAASRSSGTAPVPPWSAPPGGGGPPSSPFALLAGGLLALVLVGGGFVLARTGRRRRHAALAQSLS